MSQTVDGGKRARGRPAGSGALTNPAAKSVFLEQADWDRLAVVSDRQHESVATVIRRAVREYLEREEQE